MTAETHPAAELGLYADGALPPERAARVTAHVVACAACRADLATLERGVAAARSLEVVPLPPHRAAAIARTLAEAPIGRERPRGSRSSAALAAVLLLCGAALGARALVRARLHPAFLPAAGEPIAFERLALAAHEELRGGGARLEESSASAAELREFLAAHAIGVSLREQPPSPVAFAGARVVRPASGGRAAVGLVSYLVDGRPTSLVVTRDSDVPEAPGWSRFAKRISLRRAHGLTLLTWKNSGNAYTLVTELPGAGERACFACHTDPERRRVITEAARALDPGSAANDS